MQQPKQTKYPAKPGLAAAGLLYSEADSTTDRWLFSIMVL